MFVSDISLLFAIWCCINFGRRLQDRNEDYIIELYKWNWWYYYGNTCIDIVSITISISISNDSTNSINSICFSSININNNINNICYMNSINSISSNSSIIIIISSSSSSRIICI